MAIITNWVPLFEEKNLHVPGIALFCYSHPIMFRYDI